MPEEFQTLMMSNGRHTIADFIASRPEESRRWLILAVSECLSSRCRLNAAEIQIRAREIRYRG